MKGKLITDPYKLCELVDLKKSIWHDGLRRRFPASVFYNWQFRLVMKDLNRGIIYEYTPKKKKDFHKGLYKTTVDK